MIGFFSLAAFLLWKGTGLLVFHKMEDITVFLFRYYEYFETLFGSWPISLFSFCGSFLIILSTVIAGKSFIFVNTVLKWPSFFWKVLIRAYNNWSFHKTFQFSTFPLKRCMRIPNLCLSFRWTLLSNLQTETSTNEIQWSFSSF